MLWSAGEVGGASGVTMAERTREGGCRTSGGGFSIPLGNDEPLPAARLPQRFAGSVRASAQIDFARDEPSDCADWDLQACSGLCLVPNRTSAITR